jgi:hypothetical protein
LTFARPVAASLLVFALAGCAASGKGASPPASVTTTRPTTTTALPATSASSPTTTVPATTVTSEPGGPYATFTTPDAAAAALIDAWRRGDRARAQQVATPAAITSLFAVPPPAAAPEFRGCNAGLGGVSSCFYRTGNNALSLQLNDVPPTHWRVVDATFES